MKSGLENLKESDKSRNLIRSKSESSLLLPEQQVTFLKEYNHKHLSIVTTTEAKEKKQSEEKNDIDVERLIESVRKIVLNELHDVLGKDEKGFVDLTVRHVLRDVTYVLSRIPTKKNGNIDIPSVIHYEGKLLEAILVMAKESQQYEYHPELMFHSRQTKNVKKLKRIKKDTDLKEFKLSLKPLKNLLAEYQDSTNTPDSKDLKSPDSYSSNDDDSANDKQIDPQKKSDLKGASVFMPICPETNLYDLALMTDNIKPEKDVFYVRIKEDGALEYTVLSPKGNIIKSKIDKKDLENILQQSNSSLLDLKSFDPKLLAPSMPNILEITSKRGHTKTNESLTGNQLTSAISLLIARSVEEICVFHPKFDDINTPTERHNEGGKQAILQWQIENKDMFKNDKHDLFKDAHINQMTHDDLIKSSSYQAAEKIVMMTLAKNDEFRKAVISDSTKFLRRKLQVSKPPFLGVKKSKSSEQLLNKSDNTYLKVPSATLFGKYRVTSTSRSNSSISDESKLKNKISSDVKEAKLESNAVHRLALSDMVSKVLPNNNPNTLAKALEYFKNGIKKGSYSLLSVIQILNEKALSLEEGEVEKNNYKKLIDELNNDPEIVTLANRIVATESQLASYYSSSAFFANRSSLLMNEASIQNGENKKTVVMS